MMKKFIIKICCFFLVVAVVDFFSGIVMRYMAEHARSGFTHKDNYICNQLKTDILLCGSSRCVRHYNPRIITDSLGGTCYNSGQDGNGIILSYGRLLMIKERYRPQMIICDINPEFDLLEGDDNHRYLTWLKSHYERTGIADIFSQIDTTEKFKMLSNLYRYNSRIIELLSDYLIPVSKVRNDGFSPIDSKFDKTKIKRHSKIASQYKVDSVKIDFLNRFIDESKDCLLVFVVSPRWYGMDSRQLDYIVNIAKKRNIPFFNFSNNPKYVHNDKFFRDGNHLNAVGADEFTKDLVSFLKNLNNRNYAKTNVYN